MGISTYTPTSGGGGKITGPNYSVSDHTSALGAFYPPQFNIQGGNFGAGPGLRQFSVGSNPATSGLQSVSSQATGGTLNSFNTAANRLRERIDAQTKSLSRDATQRQVGRGFGASGSLDRELGRIGGNAQFAFGQGLSDLAQGFEGLRQQGLQTALGAQSTIGDQFLTGTGLEQDFTKSLNQLDSQNFNALEDRRLRDLISQNELGVDQQKSINELILQKLLGQANIKTEADIAEIQAESAAIGSLISQLFKTASKTASV